MELPVDSLSIGRGSITKCPGNASALPTGVVSSAPLVYPAFNTGPTLYIPLVAVIRSLDDMLSSPLRQHILNYEPP